MQAPSRPQTLLTGSVQGMQAPPPPPHLEPANLGVLLSLLVAGCGQQVVQGVPLLLGSAGPGGRPAQLLLQLALVYTTWQKSILLVTRQRGLGTQNPKPKTRCLGFRVVTHASTGGWEGICHGAAGLGTILPCFVKGLVTENPQSSLAPLAQRVTCGPLPYPSFHGCSIPDKSSTDDQGSTSVGCLQLAAGVQFLMQWITRLV